LEDLEFDLVGKFLMKLKKKFSGGDEESVKVAKLKKIEQGGGTMKKFVQEFRRVARESGYKGRALVKEFKREMNRVIKRKLIKAEKSSTSIEQWYKHTTNINRHWRESQREKERLRERKKNRNQR